MLRQIVFVTYHLKKASNEKDCSLQKVEIDDKKRKSLIFVIFYDIIRISLKQE
jgi:hypothetical protein